MLSRTPKELSRSSSVLSVDGQRDFEAMISDEPNVVDQVSSSRRRTMSLGSKKSRSRTASTSGTDLRKITLHNQTRQKSREETLPINQTH